MRLHRYRIHSKQDNILIAGVIDLTELREANEEVEDLILKLREHGFDLILMSKIEKRDD